MSQDSEGNGRKQVQAVSWGTKVGFIGTGVLIGLVAYPFVRRAIASIQPKMDEVFDDLTGKAEDLAEKTSDLMARARESLGKTRRQASHEHEHAEHDSDHKKPGHKHT